MSTNTAHILDGLTASNLSVAVLPRPASKAMEIVGIANCANMMVGPTLSALLAHLFHSGSCAGARSRSQASRSTSLSALRDKALRSARSRKLALRVLSLALLAAALSAFAFVGELGRRRGRRDFRRSAGTPPRLSVSPSRTMRRSVYQYRDHQGDLQHRRPGPPWIRRPYT
jgi:hypothetical protein